MSLAGLVGILLGVWIGIEITEKLQSYLGWNEKSIALSVLAFASIFICSLLLMRLAAYLIKKSIDFTSLGVVDGLLGALLSVASWGGLIAISLGVLGDSLYLNHGPVGEYLQSLGTWVLNKFQITDIFSIRTDRLLNLLCDTCM